MSSNYDEYQKHLAKVVMGAAGPHTHSLAHHPATIRDPYTDRPTPLAMIAMRLGVWNGDTIMFDFIQAHVNKAKAFVFVVHNNDALVIEDDPLLFPSDKLITQLRLLKG